MARNGSGTMSIQNTMVPGTTITASDHNENYADIGSELTNSVAADGQTPMTGALKMSNGTAAAPSGTFNSDQDTGLYRRGVNELGFSTAGTAAGYFDASQKFWALGAVDIAGALSITGNLSVTGSFSPTALTLSGLLTLSGTSHMLLNSGTTAQRGDPTAASFRYNSDTTLPEFADGTAFASLSGAQPIAAGFKNLVIKNNAVTPDSRIDIDADAVTVETSGGRAYRLTAIDLTVNCATTGANALDAGALEATKWYFVFVIYNPTTGTTAGLASLSATAPTLPSGYTALGRFSAFKTNSSANFERIRQRGRSAVFSAGGVLAIANGAAGSVGLTSTSWAQLQATGDSGFAPTTASAVFVILQNRYDSATAVIVAAAPSDDYTGIGTAVPIPFSIPSSATSGATLVARLELETAFIYWASTGAGGAISAYGWEDNI